MDEQEPLQQLERWLSPQEVKGIKKKLASGSVLSEALRHESTCQISQPVGLVYVRRYTHNLYMFSVCLFLKRWRSARWRPVSAGGLQLWTVKRTKQSSWGCWHETDSCCGDLFVYSEAIDYSKGIICPKKSRVCVGVWFWKLLWIEFLLEVCSKFLNCFFLEGCGGIG